MRTDCGLNSGVPVIWKFLTAETRIPLGDLLQWGMSSEWPMFLLQCVVVLGLVGGVLFIKGDGD